jgi:hypothetical protein
MCIKKTTLKHNICLHFFKLETLKVSNICTMQEKERHVVKSL